MRISRADAANVVNCAAHYGVTPRAVRDWRTKDDPRWREWQARQARSAVQLEAMLGQGAVEETTPESEAEAARLRFVALQRLCDAAVARGDVAGLPVLLKSAEGAQRLLQGCRAAAEEWNVARRASIPRQELEDFIERFLAPIRELIDQGPGEIAAAIGQPEAVSVISGWFQSRLAKLAASARENSPARRTSHNANLTNPQ